MTWNHQVHIHNTLIREPCEVKTHQNNQRWLAHVPVDKQGTAAWPICWGPKTFDARNVFISDTVCRSLCVKITGCKAIRSFNAFDFNMVGLSEPDRWDVDVWAAMKMADTLNDALCFIPTSKQLQLRDSTRYLWQILDSSLTTLCEDLNMNGYFMKPRTTYDSTLTTICKEYYTPAN